MIGSPADMLFPLQMPRTQAGSLKKEVQEITGFDCKVALCGSHDTASAVMAMPAAGEDI